MSNFQLLSIDRDPIFRLGLRVALDRYPDLEVVAEVSTTIEALRFLKSRSIDPARVKKPVDLVILAVEMVNVRWLGAPQDTAQLEALAVCHELKSLYPNLSLLLLGEPLTPELLAQLQIAGVNGYCPKGRDVSQTIEAIRTVASGGNYWPTDVVANSEIELNTAVVQTVENSAASAEDNTDYSIVDRAIHKKILDYFCLSGIREIDTALAVVKADLQNFKVNKLSNRFNLGLGYSF